MKHGDQSRQKRLISKEQCVLLIQLPISPCSPLVLYILPALPALAERLTCGWKGQLHERPELSPPGRRCLSSPITPPSLYTYLGFSNETADGRLQQGEAPSAWTHLYIWITDRHFLPPRRRDRENTLSAAFAARRVSPHHCDSEFLFGLLVVLTQMDGKVGVTAATSLTQSTVQWFHCISDVPSLPSCNSNTELTK